MEHRSTLAVFLGVCLATAHLLVYSPVIKDWVGHEDRRSARLSILEMRMRLDIVDFEFGEQARLGPDKSVYMASNCEISVLAGSFASCTEPYKRILVDEFGHRFELDHYVRAKRPQAWWPASYEAGQDDWPRSIVPGNNEFEATTRELEWMRERQHANDPPTPEMSMVHEALQEWEAIFVE